MSWWHFSWPVVGAGLAPALLAGLGAALVVTSPAAQVARAAKQPGRIEPGPDRPPGSRAVEARPDAAPLIHRVLVALVGGIALGLAGTALGGVFVPVGWVAMPVVTVAVTVVLGRLEPAHTRRRQQSLILDLPQALELLSACLAAGMPLRQSTAAVAGAFDGPIAEDLGGVLALVDLGVFDSEAWHTLRGHPQWGPIALDLARSVESGTMMVQVLMHHARDARSRRHAHLEVRAKAVGVRSVLPLMTCFLPAFMLLGVGPTVASALLNALA